MSDHAWTREQLAAYVTGGLTDAEIARVDAHARGCADCAASLVAAREADRGLQALFADVRPGLELEDGAIRSTRTIRSRRFGTTNWLPRLAVAAVVMLGLCMVGAMADGVMRDGRLPLPGSGPSAAYRPSQLMDQRDLSEVAQAGRGEAARDGYETMSEQQRAALVDAERARNQPAKGDELSRSLSDNLRSLLSLGQSAGINGGIQGGASGFGGGIGGIGGGIGGGQGHVRGIPLNLTPQSNSFSLPGPVFFGGQPQPVQSIPSDGKPVQGQPAEGAKINVLTDAPKAPAVGYGFKPSEHWRVVVGDELKVNKNVDGQIAPQPPGTNPPAAEPEQPARRIVIRSGNMEFEVTSFDEAVAVVSKLVAGLNGAFVATVNSEKLANGKVRGSVTVRTPPEHLDRLVIELRRDLGATGELKGMQIGSQDITKQYTDMESRLRAARTMETRLLQIIKDGKGEIKDLLQAEKELGVWRTKIEELEGEIRYYSNLAALATLTIKLAEKEIRAAASVTESERVQAGVETEDVDKAYQQTLATVIELKGRVAKSELKQLAAGQFNASLQFEVPHDSAGLMRDRLRQLGRMARLEIDRVQKAADGSTPTDAKVKRGDTLFIVQIYNLANVAPRETVTLQLAVPDVRAGYQSLRDAIGKSNGRVLAAQLNEQDVQNVTAQVDVEIRRPEEGAIRTALDAAGETVSRHVTRAPEGDDTTDTKMLYRVTFLATNRLAPREITALTLEVQDVEQTATTIADQVAEVKGRQLNSQSARDQSGKVTTRVSYEVPLAAAGIVEKFKSSGTVQTRQSARDLQAVGGKYATARFDLTLVSRDPIVAEDDGLWPQIRRGLTFSMTVLLTSVTWVVFGLCVVLPWGIAGYAGYRLFRRFSRRSEVAAGSARA